MHCMQRAPICQRDERMRQKVKVWNSFLVGEGDEKQSYSKQVVWKLRWKAKSARSPSVCIWLDFGFLQLHRKRGMPWSSLLFTLFWAAWFWFLPLHPLHTHTSYLFINSLSLLSKWKQWIIFFQVIELNQVTEGSNECQSLWGKKNGSGIFSFH